MLPRSADSENNRGLLQESARSAFIAGSTGLLMVESRIKLCLASDADALTTISNYLLELGGKRVRPLIAVLSGKLFHMDPPSPELIDAASGIEMIHMATLLHDDIIDASATRRGQTSAFVKYGLTDTLLTGDFLLVKAFGICAKLDRFIIEETERACVELTEGEILEGRLSVDRGLRLEGYLDIIGKKTASLFELAAVVGAHCAGAQHAEIELMRCFGRSAGLAFQIIDDILDITADADLLGKPSGTDLKQRTPSLPNILWLQSGETKAIEFFSADSEPDSSAVSEAMTELKKSAVIDQARAIAKEHAGQATNALSALNPGTSCQTTRSMLTAMVDYTLDRCL